MTHFIYGKDDAVETFMHITWLGEYLIPKVSIENNFSNQMMISEI